MTVTHAGLLARRLLPVAAACTAIVTLAGCQDVAVTRAAAETLPATTAAPIATLSPTTPPPPPVYPKPVVVAAGLSHGLARWDRPLAIHVHHGRPLSVQAVDTTTKAPVDGTLTATGWVAATTEVPGRTYRITTVARGQDGTVVHRTLSIRTTGPAAVVDTSVSPYGDATVGVGATIVVTFSQPVTDRAATAAALTVSTSVPVTGAWRWFSPTEVHWRPKEYWPAHTKVSVHLDLLGVQVAAGVWGLRNRDVHFTIGDAHVTTVDVATQTMTVTSNGAVLARYPVSTGRAKYPTKGGVHVVLAKVPSIVMDSRTVGIPKSSPDFYYETVLWDVRISDGGAFVHYAPWSVAAQGRRPVSHGCVNVNLSPAISFYNLSIPGDIVDVVNATVGPNRNDPGMADWNDTWQEWKAAGLTS
ncbi:L,D-transpeptidase LdtMt2 [Acidothermaceae bacterium B102]|nr:L,D-transpeptidase LdtMt2 [Acidothermaceae bacterium B102]